MNKMSKFGEKALDLNASSSMPDLPHQNKINLLTPCHFHLKPYFLLVKPLLRKHPLLTSHQPVSGKHQGLSSKAGQSSRPWAVKHSFCTPAQQICMQTTTVFICTWKKVAHTLIFTKQSSWQRGADCQRTKFSRRRNSRSHPLPETQSCTSIMNQLLFVLRLGANHH